MMARVSFATALGTGNLPLEQPQFEADAGGADAARANRGYFNKRGITNVKLEGAKPGHRMTPPQAEKLEAALGRSLSANSAGAIETAPPGLRAAMVLGSPEFMMR
jgi:hypothetical protein